MLQGTLALQFGFRTAGRNPEVLEQQLRDTKYTPPCNLPTERKYDRNRKVMQWDLEEHELF
jgi:hypothetical protein